jgi:hypothetical protein
MANLHLLMAPACPKELGGLVSSQPSRARKTFGWQNNPNNTSMKALGCVVVDGRPQVLKVTPCTTSSSPSAHIIATSLAGYVGEHPATPKIIEAFQSFIKLCLIDLPVAGIVVIDRQDISNVYCFNVPHFPGGLVFGRNVG